MDVTAQLNCKNRFSKKHSQRPKDDDMTATRQLSEIDK